MIHLITRSHVIKPESGVISGWSRLYVWHGSVLIGWRLGLMIAGLRFLQIVFEWNIKTDPHDKHTLPSLNFFIFIFVADNNID